MDGCMDGWYANDGPTELRYTHYNIKNERTIANYGGWLDGWMDVWMFVVDSLAQANILKRISTFICETLVEFRYKKTRRRNFFRLEERHIPLNCCLLLLQCKWNIFEWRRNRGRGGGGGNGIQKPKGYQQQSCDSGGSRSSKSSI